MGLGPELRFYDERDYLTLADNLVDKGAFSFDGVHPTAGRPPAWPVFLAGLRAAGLSVEMLRMVNVGLYISCLVLLYRMLKRSHSATVGLTAALLCVFYVLFFYTSATLYPQMFQAVLLLGFITLLFEAGAASGRRRLVAGVCAGVLILTVPLLVAVLPLLVVLAPGSRRDRVVTGGVVALVVLVMVGGWTVRNYHAFGTFIFVSTNGGYNLLLGNSENPGASRGVNVDLAQHLDRAEDLDEVEEDRYFRSAAVRWASENPHQAAGLYLRKLLNWFHFRNNFATPGESLALREAVLGVSYGMLLLLAGVRLVLRKNLKMDPRDVAFALVYLVAAVVNAFFITRIRYRIPFDFLLVGLAAPAGAAVVGWMRTWGSSTDGLALLGTKAGDRRQRAYIRPG